MSCGARIRPRNIPAFAIMTVAAGLIHIGTAAAQDAGFGSLSAVDAAELAEQRAGSVAIAGDDNTIGDVIVATSEQNVNGSTSDHTIGGDAPGGGINIGDTALGSARGMINVTNNTGPQALVQGIMSLAIVFKE